MFESGKHVLLDWFHFFFNPFTYLEDRFMQIRKQIQMGHCIPKRLPATVSGGKNNFYKLFNAFPSFLIWKRKKNSDQEDLMYLIYSIWVVFKQS